ncbi:MAG: cation transporter [Clostridia bacterium]|nr:cation transporter [Clostridia bacterium]
MISILARIFIKDRNNAESNDVRTAYGTLCGIMGIIFNVILFGIKLFAGIISGAISVISDAFNNLTDAASSIVTLLGFRFANQKADEDHPFGHGRIEYISGLVVSMLIILVGFELGKGSVEKILNPEKIEFRIVTLIILCISILVKTYMAVYNFGIGKKISSAAMKATATDSLCDCIATSAVLICLIISKFTGLNLDAYCGILVSAFILFSGIRAAKETIDPLLGTPPGKEYIERISNIVYSYEGVAGIHDLIVHDYGPGRTMISLHAEVASDVDILVAHDMIDEIEMKLRSELNCDAVIHMDPIVTNDETILEAKEKISSLITVIDNRLTLHDFRMVQGPTHTNVIFDVVVPYNMQKTDKEIKKDIEKIIKTIDKTYNAVINIDKSYV